MPDMYVMRPADARETEIMMREALKIIPSSIMLKGLPLKHSEAELANASKGGWAVKDAETPDLVIYATGSEVSLAMKASELLEANGTAKNVKVVSLPCWEIFDKQSSDYKKSVLSPDCKRKVSIEAGVTTGWEKFVGFDGMSIGVDRYGMSAPAKDLEKFFSFTPEQLKRLQRITSTSKILAKI